MPSTYVILALECAFGDKNGKKRTWWKPSNSAMIPETPNSDDPEPVTNCGDSGQTVPYLQPNSFIELSSQTPDNLSLDFPR